MSRRNSLIAKQLPKIAQSIPTENFLITAQTEELKQKFNSLRESAMEIAECLSYKFGRGGNNPISVAFRQGLLNELERDCYQLEIDLHFKQWEIISEGWELYLKEYFLPLGRASEIELFQAVLTEVYDSCLNAAKKGYTIRYQKREKALRLLRNTCWNPTEEKIEELKNPENLELLKNCIPVDLVHWNLITERLRPESSRNRTLKRKFEEFNRLVIELVDLQSERLKAQRKEGKTCSIKWESGYRYRGVKGGWSKVT